MTRWNQKLGQRGEDIAAHYLQNKGYRILARNWRYAHTELDIIAGYGSKVVFVEVKTRKTLQYGYPEESLNIHKIKGLQKAAEAYLFNRSDNPEIRFDVISIWNEGGKRKVKHIEDAF